LEVDGPHHYSVEPSSGHLDGGSVEDWFGGGGGGGRGLHSSTSQLNLSRF